MKRVFQFFSHTLVNTFLLALLVFILISPVGFSLVFLTSEETTPSTFRLTPSTNNYEGYLSFGEVAGGQAEEITVNYTAFPDFEAFYDGIFVVENTQKTRQTFVIKKPQEENVRLFFGKIGAEDGPTEMSLEPGEKATVNLAAKPIADTTPITATLTFTLQSFPEK